MIRSISEYKAYIPLYIPIIEKEIFPLFIYLNDVEKIDFDEDILLLISSFLKISKKLTTLMMESFKYFKVIFKKCNSNLGNLLETINYFIIYGEEFFLSNTDNIKIVKNYKNDL